LRQVLRDGDRIELCRALTVDPKEARRLRYKGQRKEKRPAGAGR
jgi:putative ubiquitin-RnfH superfamily antitoxin RatB of RatAB toxin-antitoxin module